MHSTSNPIGFTTLLPPETVSERRRELPSHWVAKGQFFPHDAQMVFPDVTEGGIHAFVAGLITSPHCVGMCGPLFCAMIPLKEGDTQGGGSTSSRQQVAQIAYHSARVASYALAGLAAGWLSLRLIGLFQWDFSRYFPWALAAFLMLFAVGADRWLPKGSPAFSRRAFTSLAKIGRHHPVVPFSLLGFFSPLLPCAPLYMVLYVALISGSPLFGMQIMLGFALGTIPLLWVAQSQFLRHRAKWASRNVRLIQRSLALLAALMLIVRATWVGLFGEGGACIGG